MARPATSPAHRLRVLASAKIKVDKLKRGTLLEAGPMAAILEVGWPTLRGWCVDFPGFAESGAFTSGGQGVNYEFNPRATVRWLTRYFENEQKRGREKATRLRRIVAGDALANVDQDLSLHDLDKMIGLVTKVQDQRERQGQLIDAKEAETAFRTYSMELQQAVLRAAQEQDPNGIRWSPAVREDFENALRSILLAMERAGRDCLSALRGNAAQFGEPDPPGRGAVGRSVPARPARPARGRPLADQAA